MLENRSEVSTKLKQEILNLVKDIDDEREKIKTIYKFMQNQTRYVSIQLGLGGFQPFPALTVETTGYGDCKALSNYTKTLLSIADIKSYYCEIGVQNTRVLFDDFPSPDQTNHIVLCVPLEADTIWLECTSQTMPFGYLPYSLQNQKVVLIDEDRGVGEIVNTPQSSSNYNLQRREVNLTIDELGNASGFMHTQVRGGEIDNLAPELWLPDGERKEIIHRKFGIPGFVLKTFEYGTEEQDTTKAFENITFAINRFASKTGNRLFVRLNPFGSSIAIPAKSKNRKNDLVITSNRTHFETYVFTIPQGYRVESMPNNKNINSHFGSIEVNHSYEGDTYTVNRVLTLQRQRLPSSEFSAFVDFLTEVNRAINQALVLVMD